MERAEMCRRDRCFMSGWRRNSRDRLTGAWSGGASSGRRRGDLPSSLPLSLPPSFPFFLFLSSLSTPSCQCLYKDTLEWTSSPNGAVLLNGNAFHIKGKLLWEGKREEVKHILPV